MPLEIVKTIYPIPQEQYIPYLREGIHPPLDITRIHSGFLTGEQRRTTLQTPFTGQGSLVIAYQRNQLPIEGAIISFGKTNEELSVLQIQGARSSVSYRLTTGLTIELFTADQIRRIACLLARGGYIGRVIMPFFPEGIEGSASDRAFDKYRVVAMRAGLQEIDIKKHQFVCETKDLPTNCKKSCEACLPEL